MQRFGTFLFASAVLSLVLIKFGDKVAPLGRLPGDDLFAFGGFTFPIVSCLVVSGVLSLVTGLVRKARRGSGDGEDL
jgi:hypothetical protein